MLTAPTIPADLQATLGFTVNGKLVTIATAPGRRLSRVLREDLGLIGTKVGCDAGDCGACTVLLDGDPVCSCLVPAAQAEGHAITTVEGLASRPPLYNSLQCSFLTHGAAQCGACTPGMLVTATALLEKTPQPSEAEVMDALGGVLCRCTGYRKIISAVLDTGKEQSTAASPAAGFAVGTRLVRLDGQRKVDGTEIYGADQTHEDALNVRVIRSPHHRAKFCFGDLDKFLRNHPGIQAVFTARDVPGNELLRRNSSLRRSACLRRRRGPLSGRSRCHAGRRGSRHRVGRPSSFPSDLASARPDHNRRRGTQPEG